MHGKPRGWYTVWSGKVSQTHRISHLLVLGFAIPAASLSISPLGESAPLTSCFSQFAIRPEDEQEEGGTNERLALGVWTGTCHSNFQSGRRINQRLSLPPGTRIGPEAILRFCSQLPKNRVEKWSSGALQFTNLQGYKWKLLSKNILR